MASLRLAAVLALAFCATGCAVSGSLGSMFAKQSKDEASAYAVEDATGSIASRTSALAAGLPSETDLVFARMAVVDVLRRGSKEISAPWENPASGAHGTITPIASAYERDGGTCRDFLASYVRHGAETWLQGEACRAKTGGKPSAAWEVKSLRPWSRS